jgi:teichuronic acid biosynthesis glycosyltransferase TuaC
MDRAAALSRTAFRSSKMERLSLRILAVTNLYPSADAPASGAFIEQQIKGLRQIGLNVDVMVVDRLGRGMSCYLGLGRKVQARIVSYQPDLVHVMYGGVVADMVTRAVREVPTVVSFCGSDLLGELLSGPIRKFISRYGVMASHKAARRATAIIVKSENLRDALPNDVDHSKVRIIPNGIDLERFRPLSRKTCRARLGWNANHFHVVFSANSGDPVKRPDLARAAIDRVIRSGIPAELHYLCGVGHDEVPVWLNASDALLLTSLHEGSPNTVKEALACNLSIVSVDVGDVRERIRGIEGCYIALAEPGDLAKKLSLVHDSSRRVSGRVKMHALSLQRTAQRLKEVYEEILLSKKRVPA